MEKKNIDWSNIGFGYVQTDKRYVSNYKDGAWDEGTLTDDRNHCTSMNVQVYFSMHRHVLKE